MIDLLRDFPRDLIEKVEKVMKAKEPTQEAEPVEINPVVKPAGVDPYQTRTYTQGNK